jgi:hypothetical protein
MVVVMAIPYFERRGGRPGVLAGDLPPRWRRLRITSSKRRMAASVCIPL